MSDTEETQLACMECPAEAEDDEGPWSEETALTNGWVVREYGALCPDCASTMSDDEDRPSSAVGPRAMSRMMIAAQIHELAGDLDEAAVELLTAGLEERQNNQLRVQAGLAPQPLSIEDAQLEQVIKSIPKSIAALIFGKKEAQE